LLWTTQKTKVLRGKSTRASSIERGDRARRSRGAR
jgi:hypothetical protein